jgi:putative transposase
VRRGPSVIHDLHVHLVFATQYRHGAFTDQILTRCEQLMRDVCARLRASTVGRHFWSPSYVAGSCGGPPLSIIKDYIDQQKYPD